MTRQTERISILTAAPANVTLRMVFDPERGYLRLHGQPGKQTDLAGAGITTAIVDSGVLTNHPDISRRRVDAVDFTGEGVEDVVGHGTLVTLLYLLTAPDFEVVSVKVIDADGYGRVRPLLRALAWLKQRADVHFVNLSAGAYRPKCVGRCSICNPARRLAGSGKIVTAAAGNLPGITACPAKSSDAAISVTAVDPTTGIIADLASPAGKKSLAAEEPQVSTSWVK